MHSNAIQDADGSRPPTSRHRSALEMAGAILPSSDSPSRRSAVLRVWDEALCAQVDPELFFPDAGQPARGALAVCGSCGVRELCRDVFGPLVSYGVVGGTTAQQRAAARRAGRRMGEVAA